MRIATGGIGRIVVVVDILIVVPTSVRGCVGHGGLLGAFDGSLSTLVLGLVLSIDTSRVVIKVHVAEQDVKSSSQDSTAEGSNDTNRIMGGKRKGHYGRV